MSSLVVVALAMGTAFAMSLRWWERNPEAGRGGEPWLAGTLVGALLLTDLAMQAVVGGRPGLAALIAVFSTALAPWTLARTLAIPAGAWRAAAALGGLSGWAWNGDGRRGALVAAAAALAQRPDPAGIRWVAAHLAGDVSAPAVVARAALAQARGDATRAHALAHVALDFAATQLPDAGRSIARSIARTGFEPRPAIEGDAPLPRLAARWESVAASASDESRGVLVAALEELSARAGTPVAALGGPAPTLIGGAGYRADDPWRETFDDLERRLDRPGALDPEAELHRWTRLRESLERGLEDPSIWYRCERLLQRFAVRLHRTPDGGPLAISVLRWVRQRAWVIGDTTAADSAESNLTIAAVH